MTTINVYWTDPEFAPLEDISVSAETAKLVLEQWDAGADTLSFVTLEGRIHRIRTGEIRRMRVDPT